MQTIKITCDTCNKTWDVTRDKEAPKSAISMGCNWCPDCEDKAEEDYNEWYNKGDSGEKEEDIPDNQLCMPFPILEIEKSITINTSHYEHESK